jgi:hypothetical protein
MKKILVTLFVLGTMFVGQNVDAQVGATSSLEILSPQSNRTHIFDSDIYVFWKPSILPVDYYYITIGNSKIDGDFGVLVGQSISSATTSYIFKFDQSILKTFLANSKYSESILQDSYYIRIVGIKRGILFNSIVDQSQTGNFSISPSSGIFVGNASIGDVPESNVSGKKYRYSLITKIDLYNSSTTPIFI